MITNSLNKGLVSKGFVIPAAPSSCVMTEWLEWEPCSTTCGLGTRRRERMIKMPSRDGSTCNAEMAEVEKCMMPKCRKLSQTFENVLIGAVFTLTENELEWQILLDKLINVLVQYFQKFVNNKTCKMIILCAYSHPVNL